MTIAAGFVVRNGILLCADMLFSDGETREYREKIFPWFGKHASICFAVSGPDVARVAVDHCRDALAAWEGETLLTSDAMGIIRPIVKYMYDEFVDAKPCEDRDRVRFRLMVGIAPASEVPTLYVTVDGAIAPVAEFDCIGSGRQLARYVIGRGYDKAMTVDQVAILAIQALAATKEVVDGVGGRSQFIVVRDNKLSPVVAHDIDESEAFALRYQERCAKLLLAAGDGEMADADFRHRLDVFTTQILQTRKDWLASASPWKELLDQLRQESGGG